MGHPLCLRVGGKQRTSTGGNHNYGVISDYAATGSAAAGVGAGGIAASECDSLDVSGGAGGCRRGGHGEDDGRQGCGRDAREHFHR